MSMRLFTPEEFGAELERRRCRDTGEKHDFGFVWRAPGERIFLVPHPEEDSGRYPDWMLDDLIERLGLPDAGKNH